MKHIRDLAIESMEQTIHLPQGNLRDRVRKTLQLVIDGEGHASEMAEGDFRAKNNKKVVDGCTQVLRELEEFAIPLRDLGAEVLVLDVEERQDAPVVSTGDGFGWTDWKTVADWRAVFEANGLPNDAAHFSDDIRKWKLESDSTPDGKKRRFRVAQLRLYGFKGF